MTVGECLSGEQTAISFSINNAEILLACNLKEIRLVNKLNCDWPNCRQNMSEWSEKQGINNQQISLIQLANFTLIIREKRETN